MRLFSTGPEACVSCALRCFRPDFSCRGSGVYLLQIELAFRNTGHKIILQAGGLGQNDIIPFKHFSQISKILFIFLGQRRYSALFSANSLSFQQLISIHFRHRYLSCITQSVALPHLPKSLAKKDRKSRPDVRRIPGSSPTIRWSLP